VCDAYKKSLKRKYEINVVGDVPLETAEGGIAQMFIDKVNKIVVDRGLTFKYNKLFGLSIEFDMEIKEIDNEPYRQTSVQKSKS
jgi:hypothetical protein